MGDFKVFFGPFSHWGSKKFGGQSFGGQNFWASKNLGGQNFWGSKFLGSKFLGVQNFWGSKFFEVKFLGGSKFSSYIFIKSLIQNQTNLEFDFKDPVLYDLIIMAFLRVNG